MNSDLTNCILCGNPLSPAQQKRRRRYCSCSCRNRAIATIPSRTQPHTIAWASEDGKLWLTTDELIAYQEVIAGSRRKLPNGYWHGEDGLSRAAALLRYNLTRRGITNRPDIIAHANLALLEELHLSRTVNDGHITVQRLFALAYPKLDIRAWELATMSRSYWERGGDEAKLAAVSWWLARMGWTAAEAARKLDHRRGVYEELRAAGLGELTGEGELRRLLFLLDPRISAEQELGGRRSRAAKPKLICPWCGKEFIQLTIHAMRSEGKTAADVRAVLEQTETDDLRAWRRMYTSRPTLPRNRAVLTDAGISIPADIWPTESNMAVVKLSRRPLALYITPATKRSIGTRSLHPEYNRRRLTLRLPHWVVTILRECGGEIRQEDGGHILVLLGSLDKAKVAKLERWLHRRPAELSDLRIPDGRDRIMVLTQYWPPNATHAGVGWTGQHLVIVPLAEDEFVARVEVEGEIAARQVVELTRYALKRIDARVHIYARGLLQTRDVPAGDWRREEHESATDVQTYKLALLAQTCYNPPQLM